MRRTRFFSVTSLAATASLTASLALSANAFAYMSNYDVVYDKLETTELKMDVYASATKSNGPHPALVYIHGGCFNSGSKADIGMDIKSLADQGFVVFSLDYRLSDVAKYPAAVSDVQQAIRFIRRNSSRFGIDPDKLATHGESAGGYLASILGLRASPDRNGLVDSYSSRVAVVSDWYGRTDFTLPQTTGTDCAASFLGLPRNATTSKKFQEASLLSDVDDKSAAFYIMHGTADTQVSPIHSTLLASSLWKAGRAAEYTLAEGKAHAFIGGIPWTLTRRFLLKSFRLPDDQLPTHTDHNETKIDAGATKGSPVVAGFLNDAYDVGGFTFSYKPAPTTRDTSNSGLFETVRAGASFGYDVPSAAGVYKVDLWFAENSAQVTQPGQRIFDVTAQGTTVLTQMDLYALAGPRRAFNRNFQLITTSPDIKLRFTAKTPAMNAVVSALMLSQVPY